MIEKQITAYWCDHCNKFYQRKKACQRHEDGCTNNPKNHNACFSCMHCENKKVEFESIGRNGLRNQITSHRFQCNKLDQLMFPYSAKKWARKYPLSFEDQVQMPNTCEHQQLAKAKKGDEIKINKTIKRIFSDLFDEEDIPF